MFDQPHVSLGRDFARALDPVLLAKDCGIIPDDVQIKLLTTTSRRVLLCCTRQWGKSTCAALIALHECLYQAPAMVLCVSPSQSQSVELFSKLHQMWAKLPGAPEAHQESLTRMQLANGWRIVSLPGSERTTRGWSGCTLLIIDEAARVPEELLAAVRPTLAATNGRFLALSTPAGKRGWFYEAWTHGVCYRGSGANMRHDHRGRFDHQRRSQFQGAKAHISFESSIIAPQRHAQNP